MVRATPAAAGPGPLIERVAPPRLRALDARRFGRKKGGDPSSTLLIRLLVRAQSDARSSLVSGGGREEDP